MGTIPNIKLSPEETDKSVPTAMTFLEPVHTTLDSSPVDRTVNKLQDSVASGTVQGESAPDVQNGKVREKIVAQVSLPVGDLG